MKSKLANNVSWFSETAVIIAINFKSLKFDCIFFFMSAILNFVSLHYLLAYICLHSYEWNTTQHYYKASARSSLIG